MATSDFIELLDIACGRVGRNWFQLPFDRIGAGTQSRYRERVYCYELYHQLRLTLPRPDNAEENPCGYLLSGEIDKAGLDAMTMRGREKPDMVWHKPGTSNNGVVLEVKAARPWSPAGVVKDLRTLTTFLDAPGRAYSLGLLLVFGDVERESLLRKVRELAAGMPDADVLKRARLALHRECGTGIDDLGPIA